MIKKRKTLILICICCVLFAACGSETAALPMEDVSSALSAVAAGVAVAEKESASDSAGKPTVSTEPACDTANEQHLPTDLGSSAEKELLFPTEKNADPAEKPLETIESPEFSVEKPFAYADKPAVSAEEPVVSAETPVSRAEELFVPTDGLSVPAEKPEQNHRTKESPVTKPQEEEADGTVWVPVNGGKRYHTHAGCSDMKEPVRVQLETAVANGYTACGICHPERPDSEGSVTVPKEEETVGNLVWVPTKGGKKYHSKFTCSGMEDPIQVSVETAEKNGFTACKRCH